MDLARVFTALRPEAKFREDMVNYHSLATVALTYIGEDLPTQEEIDEKWGEIKDEVIAPTEVTMRQARLALLQAGKLQDIITAINGMDEAAQIEWQYAQTVKRDHPLVVSLFPALGMTDDEIDRLFLTAAAL